MALLAAAAKLVLDRLFVDFCRFLLIFVGLCGSVGGA